jgi:hypothetical protein
MKARQLLPGTVAALMLAVSPAMASDQELARDQMFAMAGAIAAIANHCPTWKVDADLLVGDMRSLHIELSDAIQSFATSQGNTLTTEMYNDHPKEFCQAVCSTNTGKDKACKYLSQK